MGDNIDSYLQSIVNYESFKRAINFQMCPFSISLPRNKSLQALWKKRSSECSFIEFLFQLIIDYEYPIMTNSITFSFWTENSIFHTNLQKRCPFIMNLSIKFCRITDIGLQIIKQAKWKFIREVNFTGNLITQHGAYIISQCKWRYVSVFIINQNNIKNKGFQYILKAKWKYLTQLQMYQNGFTPNFWKLFIKNDWNLLIKLVIFEQKLQYQIVRSFLQIVSKLQTKNLYLISLANYSGNYSASLDRNQIRIFFLNNIAKIKRNNNKLTVIIDMDRRENTNLDIIEENGLIYFVFI